MLGTLLQGEGKTGHGDELIATGLAKGVAAKGKRIAFGNGRDIIWSKQSFELFRDNPNVAPPGSERDDDIQWIRHYRGNRLYGQIKGGRWAFVPFRCPPGEIFFSDFEIAFGDKWGSLVDVIVEPRVKPYGACNGANKQWPVERYQEVVNLIHKYTKFRVGQVLPIGAKPLLEGTTLIRTQSFRDALAVLRKVRLYIGPEGGLHHGAAAVGIRAVVIWGGFNSPNSTGYDNHVNLTGSDKPCGSLDACRHCAEAMRSITVHRVMTAVDKELGATDVLRRSGNAADVVS